MQTLACTKQNDDPFLLPNDTNMFGGAAYQISRFLLVPRFLLALPLPIFFLPIQPTLALSGPIEANSLKS